MRSTELNPANKMLVLNWVFENMTGTLNGMAQHQMILTSNTVSNQSKKCLSTATVRTELLANTHSTMTIEMLSSWSIFEITRTWQSWSVNSESGSLSTRLFLDIGDWLDTISHELCYLQSDVTRSLFLVNISPPEIQDGPSFKAVSNWRKSLKRVGCPISNELWWRMTNNRYHY